MTFLSGTPVECTIHPSLWEDSFTSFNDDEESEDPDDTLEFVKLAKNNGTEYVRMS